MEEIINEYKILLRKLTGKQHRWREWSYWGKVCGCEANRSAICHDQVTKFYRRRKNMTDP